MNLRQATGVTAALIALASLPLAGNDYFVTLAIEILIWGTFVSGVNLLLGYTGLVPLGNAMFVGLGAYSYAILIKAFGFPIFVAFAVAVAGVALLALVIGAVCTRAREVEFLLITLAFCQMFYGAAMKLKLTGGSDGMTGVPRPNLESLGIHSDTTTGFYIVVLIVSAGMLALLWRIIQSPFGSVLVGIRENERRLESMGYRTSLYKTIAFAVAALFAGVAGVLTAQYTYFINPEMMTWQIGGEAILMVLMGGRKHLFGAFLGAAIFILAKQALSAVTQNYLIFFGLFFMLVVAFLKDGALGLLDNLWNRWNGHKRPAHT